MLLVQDTGLKRDTAPTGTTNIIALVFLQWDSGPRALKWERLLAMDVLAYGKIRLVYSTFVLGISQYFWGQPSKNTVPNQLETLDDRLILMIRARIEPAAATMNNLELISWIFHKYLWVNRRTGFAIFFSETNDILQWKM